MLYRTLGRSGIKTSLVSYGTGGPRQFGRSSGLTAQGRKRLVGRVLDLGINLFDTAEAYGGGDSERWLGETLAGVPRDSYVICTKWRLRGDETDLREPSELIASFERSLSRLCTDVVDVMMLHGPRPGEYEAAVDRYGDILQRLKDEGKARTIGFSEMMTDDPKHTVPEHALEMHPDLWDVVMIKYGILNQWAAKSVLPLAEKHGVGILNMAPVRYTLTRPDEYETLLRHWRDEGSIDVNHPKIRDGYDWLVGGDVQSVIAAGYKFAAEHPAISSVITGTSSVEHLEENVAAMENPTLTPHHLAELKSLLGDSYAPR